MQHVTGHTCDLRKGAPATGPAAPSASSAGPQAPPVAEVACEHPPPSKAPLASSRLQSERPALIFFALCTVRYLPFYSHDCFTSCPSSLKRKFHVVRNSVLFLQPIVSCRINY